MATGFTAQRFKPKTLQNTSDSFAPELSVVLKCGRAVLPNRKRNVDRDGLQTERLITFPGIEARLSGWYSPASPLLPLPKVWMKFAFLQALGLIIMTFQR